MNPPCTAVIFTGGSLGDWALPYAREAGYLIGADSGAAFLVSRGLHPDLSLGDFDSVDAAQLLAIRANSQEVMACDPVDKDWTDTELAMREAISRGYRRIIVAGGLGGRFDHSLANVHLLRQAEMAGCEAALVDERNEIRLCSGICRLVRDDRFPYVSLLPLTLEASGIDLHGFRYPLSDATLRIGWSLGISNVIEGDEGSIAVRDGLLLVIRSAD